MSNPYGPGLGTARGTSTVATGGASDGLPSSGHSKSATLPVVPTLMCASSLLYLVAPAGILTVDSRPFIAAGVVTQLIGVIWLLAHSAGRPKRFGAKSPLIRAMALFILAWIASTAIVYLSGERLDADKFIPQTALVLAVTPIFFAVASGTRQSSAEQAIITVAHSIALIGGLSVLLDFSGVTHFVVINNRYFGFLGDPVSWAMTFPLIVYFATGRFYYAAIVAFAMLPTASRGPALVVAGATFLLLVFSRGRRLQYALSLIVVAVVLLFQSDLLSELLGRFSSTSIIQNDRVFTSLNGIRVFVESPLWGSGYNALEYYFPRIGISTKLGEFAVATSTFVQLLSEGGLLLFLPYLIFISLLTKAGLSILRKDPDIGNRYLAGVAAWLISMLWFNQSAAWLLVGSYLAPLVMGTAGVIAGHELKVRDQAMVSGGMR